jgi:hypothetical protein
MWEINIQHTKLYLDLVFCIVSFAVMEEPTVFVSEQAPKTAENCVIMNLVVCTCHQMLFGVKKCWQIRRGVRTVRGKVGNV